MGTSTRSRRQNTLDAGLHRNQALRALLGWIALTGLSVCAPGQDAPSEISVVKPDPADDGMTRAPGEAGGRIGTPTAADVALVQAPPPPFCGDGALNDDEQCDDGGTEAGDGCSANCLVVEQGYACPEPGSSCAPAAICGDSLLLLDELCDDGNVEPGDGCAANCQPESDFVCPTPGEPCVSSVECGDARISGDELCDDDNVEPNDGCSETCQTEPGWSCPIPGARCVPNCEDGLLRGQEQCDDGGLPTPGCSDTCGREDGFVCDTPGETCRATVCGDGVAEGSEGCDDGNDVPFDGCFQCVREPECENGVCQAACGDGFKYDTEDCDDGNTVAGDGCSELCTVEAGLGFACVDVGGEGATADTFTLPVIYRDFIGVDTSGDGQEGARATLRAQAAVRQHPDFNTFLGSGTLGSVQAVLVNDRPVLNCVAGTDDACTDVQLNPSFSNAANFTQWFQNVPGTNLPIVSDLVLNGQGDGSFLFDSLVDTENNQFDPLLGLGWQDPQVIGARPPAIYEGQEFCNVAEVAAPPQGTPRNMSFTTETRFVFEYVGGELFEFSGDDDVWVFINNRLILDLGGLHRVAEGTFTLSAPPAAPGVATVDREGFVDLALPVSELTGAAAVQTGMVYGGVYEAVLFHAERHECGSNFKLTLAGFDKPRSTCNEVCGDGVVSRSETCDDGPLNGTGYGFCEAVTCTPGPRCGDAVVQPEGAEVCDNGLNVDRYSTSSDACGPGCTRPSFCGDNVIDFAFGERCDDGVNDNSYGGCSPDCGLGPRCGDGSTDGDEECDDNNRVNGDGCNLSCKEERDVIPA